VDGQHTENRQVNDEAHNLGGREAREPTHRAWASTIVALPDDETG
jgi:hypothetical protein